MKRIGLTLVIGIVLSVMAVLLMDVHKTYAIQKAQELVEREKEQQLFVCLREKYPTFERTFSVDVYRDTRTGQRYLVRGTDQWNKCTGAK